MQWRDCPTEPLAWIPLRELLLSLLLTPALLLPLVAVLALLLAWWLRLPAPARRSRPGAAAAAAAQQPLQPRSHRPAHHLAAHPAAAARPSRVHFASGGVGGSRAGHRRRHHIGRRCPPA